MSGQMCWLEKLGGEGRKILHVRNRSYEQWMPYTSSPHRVPDLKVPGASKGWTTYQKLRAAGWTLIPSDQAYAVTFAEPSSVSQ